MIHQSREWLWGRCGGKADVWLGILNLWYSRSRLNNFNPIMCAQLGGNFSSFFNGRPHCAQRLLTTSAAERVGRSLRNAATIPNSSVRRFEKHLYWGSVESSGSQGTDVLTWPITFEWHFLTMLELTTKPPSLPSFPFQLSSPRSVMCHIDHGFFITLDCDTSRTRRG